MSKNKELIEVLTIIANTGKTVLKDVKPKELQKVESAIQILDKIKAEYTQISVAE